MNFFKIFILFGVAIVSEKSMACISLSGTPISKPGYFNVFKLGPVTATFNCPGTNIRWSASGAGTFGVTGTGQSITVDFSVSPIASSGSISFGARYVSEAGAETSTANGGAGSVLRVIANPVLTLEGGCMYSQGNRYINATARSTTDPQFSPSGLFYSFQLPETGSGAVGRIPLNKFTSTEITLQSGSGNFLENQFGPYSTEVIFPRKNGHETQLASANIS